MDAHMIEIARSCLAGAETGTINFPEIVRTLTAEGFEGYAIDFRRNTATYYMTVSNSAVLPIHKERTPIAQTLDIDAVQLAIREAQQSVPGYSYLSFCAKIRTAGCAGYMVSFSGRRAVYYGRTGELHVEHFPR